MAKETQEVRRRAMVDAVRTGQSIRAVARQFRVSRPTVERWVVRAFSVIRNRTSVGENLADWVENSRPYKVPTCRAACSA